MSDEEHFFQAISEFFKGQSGPQDASSAIVSFGENFNLEAFAPPRLSHSFKEYGAEYPIVRRALQKARLHDHLAILGAMSTLPELQANAHRLYILIHLTFAYARGKDRAKPAQVVAWFNQLNEGSCGRQEDAAEDVFVASVIFNGNTYRLFEGASEGNRFYTQLFLKIVEDMPPMGHCLFLKDAVLGILRISEAVADRAGLPAHLVGDVVPKSHLGKASNDFMAAMRSRVRFSPADLTSLDVSSDALEPFIIGQNDFPNLEEFSMGHTPLEAMPIIEDKGDIIVFRPSCIGVAIRHLVISHCLKGGMKEEIEEALVNAYISHFANEGILKDSPPPLLTQNVGGKSIAQLVKEFDAGRYLHLLFIFDDFNGFENGSFMAMNAVEIDTDLINKSIDHSHRTFSEKPGFREGITVIVPCGWGRFFGASLRDDPGNWRAEMIPPHDLLTLHHTPSFRAVDLLKVLDARDRLASLGFRLFNGNGFLNLYGWMVENDGHIIKHDEFRREEGGSHPSSIMIPMTGALMPRVKSYMGADVKAIRSPEGSVSRLRRVHGTPRFGTEFLSPLNWPPFRPDTRA